MNLAAPASNPQPPAAPVGQAKHQRGAYAIARDGEGRVLVVQTVSGRCYLPGGRIEAGETPVEALAREIAEECGWRSEVGAALGSGEQRILDGAVRLHASYWEARLTEPAGSAPEHVPLWLTSTEAHARLHRASDRQALALSPG